jgi:hypothetical protein
MAPEVARGEPASERSDLYSCGVLLREVLRGTSPAGLAALADRLAASDPGKRPRSAREALAELETEVAGVAPDAEAGIVSPGGARSRAVAALPVKAAALALAAVLAAAVLVVALIGGGSEEGTTGGDARQASPPATQQPTTPEAAVAPPTTTTTTVTTSPPPECAAIEQRRDALKERGKAMEEAVKENKELRDQVRERFDALEQELDEQLKACEEQANLAEGHGPPPSAGEGHGEEGEED